MTGLLGLPAGSLKAPVVLAQFSTTPETTAAYLASSSAKDCYIDSSLNRCFGLDDDFRKNHCGKAGFVPVGLAHGTAAPYKYVCPVSVWRPPELNREPATADT
jgi:hypothetical protein